MMESRYSGDTTRTRSHRWMMAARSCFSLLMATVVLLAPLNASAKESAGPGTMDLLRSPAQLSEKALISPLMDVARIGDQLIAVGDRGHILLSPDSGQTWTQVHVPVSVTLTAVHFPTARTGWTVGHDGVVLRSVDGGHTWRKQLDGTTINTLMLTKLHQVIEVQRQRLAQADPDRRGEMEIRLENLEFFLDDVDLAIREGPTRPLMDLWFQDERNGIVIGAFGMILATVDGGENWTPLLDRIDNPDGFHYYGICRSGESLFIAGEAGMLFRSDDGGQHWQRLRSPYEGTFFGITGSRDGSMVVAFGLRGSMFLSHDGGITWNVAPNRKEASISGGTVLTDGALVLACVDGTIAESRDKGKTFAALPNRFPGSIAIAETGDGGLAVAGLGGVVRMER